MPHDCNASRRGLLALAPVNNSPHPPIAGASAGLSAWHRLDLFLARLRPHREALSLAVDALVIAACWNITYLFRLGFERWISARPGYDAAVMAGVVTLYLLAFVIFKVPQSMWRFSGFGEVKRLTWACLLEIGRAHV